MAAETNSLLEPSVAGGNSLIEDWRLFLMKEKSIYAILNLCAGDILLRVNVWYPEADGEKITGVLHDTAIATGSQGATLISDRNLPKGLPPTYIRTNDLTQVWQEVVDEYGVPRYQE